MADIGRNRSGHSRAVGAAFGAGLVVMWSSGFIGAELGTRYAPADVLLTWRYVVAAPLLVVPVVVLRHRLRRAVLLRHGVLGLLCQAGYVGGIVTGVAVGVPAGTAALVAALQPLVVAALANRLLGDRTSRSQRVGLGIGVAGVALVVAGDLGTTGAPAWGYLLPLGGMLSLSLGTVLERRWDVRDRLLDGLAVQAVVVAVVLVATAAATDRLTPPAEPAFWWAVAWVVVLSTFGGYGFYFLVLRRSGATRVSTLLYLTPPSTMLWAAVAFGDRPSGLAWVGTAVCAAAVAIVLRGTGAAGPGAEDASAAGEADGSGRPGMQPAPMRQECSPVAR